MFRRNISLSMLGRIFMYRNILIATDGSKLSLKAAEHAVALAKALGASLTGFHASPDYPMPVYAEGVVFEPVSRREYAEQCRKEADKILGTVAAKAKSARVAFTAASAIASAPWEA